MQTLIECNVTRDGGFEGKGKNACGMKCFMMQCHDAPVEEELTVGDQVVQSVLPCICCKSLIKLERVGWCGDTEWNKVGRKCVHSWKSDICFARGIGGVEQFGAICGVSIALF